MDRPSSTTDQPLRPKAVKGPRKVLGPLGDRPSVERRRRWLSWMGVAAMGLVAAGSGVLSANLHDHASERRQLMDEITQLEVEATAHSTKVWRALTMLMAEDKMQFIRLRGESGQQRTEIISRMERLSTLDRAGDRYNDLLGFDPEPELLESLERATLSFVGNIQGTLAQMSMQTDRTRERLRYWDMSFGPFTESLEALKARNNEIAVSSALVAKRVATAAGLSRLLASVLLVLTFSRRRTGRRRRASDLLPPGYRRSTDRLPSAQGLAEKEPSVEGEAAPAVTPDLQKAS